MEYFSARYIVWAILLGAISAASLPLGSLVGLQTKLRGSTISVLAAFGAGALIAALAVELVAPTVFSLGESAGGQDHNESYHHFYALLVGAVFGGGLFVVLDRMVNAHGGFLRRTSQTVAYFTERTHRRKMELLEQMALFPLVKDVAPEQVNTLIELLHRVQFCAGEILFDERDEGTHLYFIIEGSADAANTQGLKGELKAGSVAGIISLIMGIPHQGTLTCREDMIAYALSKKDFDQLRHLSPEFDQAARELTAQRLEIIEKMVATRDKQSIKWIRTAGHALQTGAQIPSASQLRGLKEEHKGAPLAIWLGILLDGIPESIVIGAGLLILLKSRFKLVEPEAFIDVIPFTLIAGLFLSNFPEALASSANMRHQGWSKLRIFLLWFSLMIITAIGAAGGFILADTISSTWLSFAEGLAAGAMLTMIAAAMIPEAVHMGKANAVGLGTLAGFLAAISFKLLE
jgi:zinc transporter ZupT